MSLSLIAVFIPILFSRGRSDATSASSLITLSAAIVISLVVSLTATPMMCSRLLSQHEPAREKQRGWLYRWSESFFADLLDFYDQNAAVGAAPRAVHDGAVPRRHLSA